MPPAATTASDPSSATGADARFREEVRRSTRVTGLVATVVAIVALPAWIGFDRLVAPDQADVFTWFRLAGVVPMLAALAGLRGPLGRRRPELLLLVVIASVQAAIAPMIPRLEADHAAYALGMSLAIWSSAFLVVWTPIWTGYAIGLTWLFLGIAVLTAPEPIAGEDLATVAFYLLTVSVLAVAAQLHRSATARREFDARIALEREQSRSLELVEELDRKSREDPLTALANRRAWDEALGRECARASRGHGPLAILLCDVDRLKEVNDRLGHAAGDAVLRAVADVLRVRARDSDLVARIGGDEFGVLCADTDVDGAVALAEQMTQVVRENSGDDVVLSRITLSVGVSGWDGAGDSPDRLVLRADQQLYAAKARRDAVSYDEQQVSEGAGRSSRPAPDVSG